jgi:single-stranded DNA-specific DHH superfamily exonuclease
MDNKMGNSINYLVGKKEDFWNYVFSIDKNDRVGVFTHTDLDGIASAIFLEEILKNYGKSVDYIDFVEYRKGMFGDAEKRISGKKLDKIFMLDIHADGNDLEGFESFRNKFDTFFIDHHPITPEWKNRKNAIKTATPECVTYILYDLGNEKGILNRKNWGWLVCSTMVSEFSYLNPDNLNFMKGFFKNLNGSNEIIRKSVPGRVSDTLCSALVYFNNNYPEAYRLIKEKKLKELKKFASVVDKEMAYFMQDFEKNAEFNQYNNSYFYYFEPKFNIVAPVATNISLIKPDSVLIFASPLNGGIKISARNQTAKYDLPQILKKAIIGLDGASAGGHKIAAAATIRKEDLEEFKRNLMK